MHVNERGRVWPSGYEVWDTIARLQAIDYDGMMAGETEYAFGLMLFAMIAKQTGPVRPYITR